MHRIHCRSCQMVLGSLLGFACFAAELPPAKVAGDTVETGKHVFTVAPSGLPGQIHIRAATWELPLSARRNKHAADPKVRRVIGRGDQLQGPLQLIVRIDGKEHFFVPDAPVAPRQDGNRVLVGAGGKADKLPLRVKAVYHPNGRMDLTVTLGKAGAAVESLALALDFNGPVDTVVPGPATEKKLRAYNPAEFAVGLDEGLAWANVGKNLPEAARQVPGVLVECFVGNGDRGFTWLAPETGGFVVDPQKPTQTLVRSKDGRIRWLMYLVNRPHTFTKEQSVSFSLLTHPAIDRPKTARRDAWLGAFPATTTAMHDALPDANQRLLQGAAGGNAVSRETHLAATYPIRLHSFLAGAHTGFVTRLKSNAKALIRPGMRPGADRMAIGRALLHDIGLDPKSLAHPKEAALAVKALHDFGAFEADGKTHFVPYWRSAHLVRYGEEFKPGDAFATTKTNPLEDIQLSLWQRPAGKCLKAMILVVNESDTAMREQLYLNDSKGLLGNSNALSVNSIIDRFDMTGIPGDSDWNRGRLKSTALSHGGGAGKNAVGLLDLIDNGFVRQKVVEGKLEVYGPLHIPPRSYRILYAEGKSK